MPEQPEHHLDNVENDRPQNGGDFSSYVDEDKVTEISDAENPEVGEAEQEEIYESNKLDSAVAVPINTFGYIDAYMGAGIDPGEEEAREDINNQLHSKIYELAAKGESKEEIILEVANQRMDLLSPKNIHQIEDYIESHWLGELAGGSEKLHTEYQKVAKEMLEQLAPKIKEMGMAGKVESIIREFEKDPKGFVKSARVSEIAVSQGVEPVELVQAMYQDYGFGGVFREVDRKSDARKNGDAVKFALEKLDTYVQLMDSFNEFRKWGELGRFRQKLVEIKVDQDEALRVLFSYYGLNKASAENRTRYGRIYNLDPFAQMLRILVQETDWNKRQFVRLDTRQKITDKDVKLNPIMDEYREEIDRLVQQAVGLGSVKNESVREKFLGDLNALKEEIESSGEFGKDLAIAENDQAAQLDRALKAAVAKIEGVELEEVDANPFLTPETEPIPKEVEETKAQALEYQDKAKEWEQQLIKALNEHQVDEARKVLDIWKQNAESLAKRIMSLDREGIGMLMQLFGSEWEKVRQKGKELTDSLDWADTTVAYLERDSILESYHPMVREVVETTRGRAWEEFMELNRSKAPSKKALGKVFDEYWQEDQLSVIMAVENKLKAKGLIK